MNLNFGILLRNQDLSDVLFFSGNSSSILIKNFENFPSSSFTFIFVLRFDNLITNNITRLAQKYFSIANHKEKKSINSLKSSLSENINISHDQIGTPEFKQKNSFKPTLLSLKSNNGDLFEIFLSVEEGETKICLQVKRSKKI